MKYIIPLHPDCLEWLKRQPIEDQALLGWTLTNRGIPRPHNERNYDVTIEDLQKTLVYYWGVKYHSRAITLSWNDEFEFVPDYPHWAQKLLTIFYKVLPYIVVFLFGLVCGMDF